MKRNRKKKLQDTLAEVEGSGNSNESAWNDMQHADMSSVCDLDDKELDKMVMQRLHERAAIAETSQSSQILQSYSKEEKVVPTFAQLLLANIYTYADCDLNGARRINTKRFKC